MLATLETPSVSAEQSKFDQAFWAMASTVGFQPDGSVMPPEGADQNVWQKISDATNTVVTPANAIDLLGFAGAKYGIDNLDSWKGIAVASASFLADVVDGKVARATGTQSELGEALDAAGDKVKLAYALVKIWQMDLAPKPLLVGVAAQNGLNAGLTIADRIVNKEDPALHPSWYGKRAMFLQQAGVGLHVVGSQMEKDEMRFSRGIKIAGTVLGAAGIALGTVASVDYARTLYRSQE